MRILIIAVTAYSASVEDVTTQEFPSEESCKPYQTIKVRKYNKVGEVAAAGAALVAAPVAVVATTFLALGTASAYADNSILGTGVMAAGANAWAGRVGRLGRYAYRRLFWSDMKKSFLDKIINALAECGIAFLKGTGSGVESALGLNDYKASRVAPHCVNWVKDARSVSSTYIELCGKMGHQLLAEIKKCKSNDDAKFATCFLTRNLNLNEMVAEGN